MRPHEKARVEEEEHREARRGEEEDERRQAQKVGGEEASGDGQADGLRAGAHQG